MFPEKEKKNIIFPLISEKQIGTGSLIVLIVICILLLFIFYYTNTFRIAKRNIKTNKNNGKKK